VGGNQQGFIEILDELTVNDVSLFISNIIGDASLANPVKIVSPNHNMSTGFIINITGLVAKRSIFWFGGGIFGIYVIDQNTFSLSTYDPVTDKFSIPAVYNTGTYLGGGLISIRENFNIKSKKFNFLDEGKNIQMGYLDILMNSSSGTTALSGGITRVDLGGTSSPTPTVRIVSNKHGLSDGSYVLINGIQGTTQLNGNIYQITITANQVNSFNLVGTNALVGYSPYISGGNWETVGGAISLNVYLDYNESQPSNIIPMNDVIYAGPPQADTFFNATIPTTEGTTSNVGGTKFWQRVFCPTRASFLTLQYTFSNAQMAGFEQTTDVQIDAQILWIRKGGRMTQG